MEILREIVQTDRPSAVALGFFDGVHTAHAKVISAAVGHENTVPTVLTFASDTNLPVSKVGYKLLQTEAQKAKCIEKLGAERLITLPFESVADLSPECFFNDILVAKLGAKVISCGYDYRFGKGAAGDVTLLKTLCENAGITLLVTPQQTDHDTVISSTAIRQAVLDGDIPRANEMLGYRYTLEGDVVHGHHLGNTLGFPTLNQMMPLGLLMPKFGVYASITHIGGKSYPSITNIGIKPTIEGERAPLAETHMLGASGDFYGMNAEIELLHMIRPEKRFASLAELKQAVLQDIARREYELLQQ